MGSESYDRIVYHRLGGGRREEILRELRDLLGGEDRILLAYVFGSFTRRDAVRDVDVAVHASPPLSLEELLELGAKLELRLGLPVDLVQLRDLDPGFRLKVLRRGMPVVVKDEGLRHRLLAEAYSELQDLAISVEEARRPGRRGSGSGA